jgi:hypothetical protein
MYGKPNLPSQYVVYFRIIFFFTQFVYAVDYTVAIVIVTTFGFPVLAVFLKSKPKDLTKLAHLSCSPNMFYRRAYCENNIFI